MKKELKAVCGTILAIAAVLSAGRAGAEISIGMEPVVYSMKPAVWGQVSRSASSERLSATAQSLAEAADSGDTAKAETLLAGLFSGAAQKEAAAPVYAENKQVIPAPVLSAPVKYSYFSSTYDPEDAVEELVSEDAAADAGAAAAVAAPAETAAADEGGKEEAAKPEQSLWETLLGGGIGMLLVIILLLL